MSPDKNNQAKLNKKILSNEVKDTDVDMGNNEINIENDIDKTIDQLLSKEDLEDRQNDRKLKNSLMIFVKKITVSMLIFCLAIFIIDIAYLIWKEEHMFQQWFLISLLGSQAVVTPLLLLKIISLHLFPNDPYKPNKKK